MASGLREPLYVTHADDGSGRLFVVERRGLVKVVVNGQVQPEPFLDLTELVAWSGEEQGLLGLAFHPQYAANGLFYVYYTGKDRTVTLARYRVSDTNPGQADPESAATLFAVRKEDAAHNGGMLAFGPDGFLYVGAGDDADGANSQDPGTLFGKLLRLDVDRGDPYVIPATNPFVSRADARPEVWAMGLRNPWRFSFDPATGNLWIGDVGEAEREEINLQPADSPGGENYGWPILEGLRCNLERGCDQASLAGLTPPLYEYDHAGGANCSVISGYVYRGAAVPALTGSYLFSDLCSGVLGALRPNGDGPWTRIDFAYTPMAVSSWGEDEAGELYVVDIEGGSVYRVAGATLPPSEPFPGASEAVRAAA